MIVHDRARKTSVELRTGIFPAASERNLVAYSGSIERFARRVGRTARHGPPFAPGIARDGICLTACFESFGALPSTKRRPVLSAWFDSWRTCVAGAGVQRWRQGMFPLTWCGISGFRSFSTVDTFATLFLILGTGVPAGNRAITLNGLSRPARACESMALHPVLAEKLSAALAPDDD